MDILFDEGSFGFIPTENNDDDDSTAVGVFTAEIIPERFTDAASVEEECMEKASEIVIIRESAGTNNKHNTNVAEKILLPQPVVHLPSVNSRHLPSGNVETRSFRMPQDITETVIRSLETRMPLPAAAASIGISPAELRRICRSVGINRWNHRAHAELRRTKM